MFLKTRIRPFFSEFAVNTNSQIRRADHSPQDRDSKVRPTSGSTLPHLSIR